MTGFPAATGAVLIGKGLVKERGLVAPEDCIYGPLCTQFVADLKKRNIEILEMVESLRGEVIHPPGDRAAVRARGGSGSSRMAGRSGRCFPRLIRSGVPAAVGRPRRLREVE